MELLQGVSASIISILLKVLKATSSRCTTRLDNYLLLCMRHGDFILASMVWVTFCFFFFLSSINLRLALSQIRSRHISALVVVFQRPVSLLLMVCPLCKVSTYRSTSSGSVRQELYELHKSLFDRLWDFPFSPPAILTSRVSEFDFLLVRNQS